MILKIYIFLIIIFLTGKEAKRFSNKQKKIINIAFPINNKFIKFLYIALISLLENSNQNTIYNIYIQVSLQFHEEKSQLLFNLEKIYFNCFIHIIDMRNEFFGAVVGLLDCSIYYKLKLPILFPNLNRIIHLDSDTLILKDLMELYSLNFEEKYILGRLDILSDELDSLGIETKTYVNTGVLLLDLYSLRKYNYTKKFLEYIQNNNNKKYLIHHDQTLINYACYDKIGVLAPKYHMWPFRNKIDIVRKNKAFRIPYNKYEFFKDFYNPLVVHFPGLYKININDKGGIYHEMYYKYSQLAIEKSNNIKFSFTQKIKNLLNHYFKKIICRYICKF